MGRGLRQSVTRQVRLFVAVLLSHIVRLSCDNVHQMTTAVRRLRSVPADMRMFLRLKEARCSCSFDVYNVYTCTVQ